MLPSRGRLLGIDFGTRRLGFAVSDSDQLMASPLENYTRRNDNLDGKHLQKVIRDYGIVGIVVGLPLHLSGDESEMSQKVRKFGSWVAELTQLEVCFHDERHTSSIAEDFLLEVELTKKQRKARIDKLASQLILQSLLNLRISLRSEFESDAQEPAQE